MLQPFVFADRRQIYVFFLGNWHLCSHSIFHSIHLFSPFLLSFFFYPFRFIFSLRNIFNIYCTPAVWIGTCNAVMVYKHNKLNFFHLGNFHHNCRRIFLGWELHITHIINVQIEFSKKKNQIFPHFQWSRNAILT